MPLKRQIKKLLRIVPHWGGVVIVLLLYTNEKKSLAIGLAALYIVWHTAKALYTLHSNGSIDALAIAIKNRRKLRK